MMPIAIMDTRSIAANHYDALRRQMTGRAAKGGYDFLVKICEEAYFAGGREMAEQHDRAWSRVEYLEKLLTDLLRYVPVAEADRLREGVAHDAD